MAGWKGALAKTRNLFKKVFAPKAAMRDAAEVEEFEELLLRSDIPPALVMEIVEELEMESSAKKRMACVRSLLMDALGAVADVNWTIPEPPFVLLLLGVNGSGKTTTAAKLAKRTMKSGLKPMLCGSDTFRAAGSSQLKLWSEKVGCDFVGGEMGADAAGVAYNALDSAVAKSCDLVVVDSAGRMHTKAPLMDELPKMCRSMNKRIPGAPHQVWMVLDASLGQNAVIQAREFNEVVPLSGLVITKLDGSSKAGFVFSVRKELNIPVLFAGLGEGEDDLVPFEPESFVDALFAFDPGEEE